MNYFDVTGEFATAAVATYVIAGVVTISVIYMAEHRKRGTMNKANEPKHQKGQARKKTDSFGGEKGDKRRKPRKDKKK